jgi:hypothetical protein
MSRPRGYSQYSMDYSKKPPHPASIEAQTKVEQLQNELASAPEQKEISPDLGALKSVPLRSLGMLICKTKVGSEVAAVHYPRRPPMTADVQKVAHAGSGRLAMPAFLIHFS